MIDILIPHFVRMVHFDDVLPILKKLSENYLRTENLSEIHLLLMVSKYGRHCDPNLDLVFS